MIKGTLGIITATVTVTAMAGSIFLNSILGAFNMAVTSVDNLNSLRESRAVVNKLKQRHETRKLDVTRKFTRKAGKRAVASGAAAITVGTAAVVVTVAAIEAMDYCDEKKELNDEGNILYGTSEPFDYKVCMESAQEDSKELVDAAVEGSSDAVKEAWLATKEYSHEVWDALTRSIADLYESTTESASDILSAWKEWLEI